MTAELNNQMQNWMRYYVQLTQVRADIKAKNLVCFYSKVILLILQNFHFRIHFRISST